MRGVSHLWVWMKTQSSWESIILAQLMTYALKFVNEEIIFIYIQILKNSKIAMKHASGIHMPQNISLFLSQILSGSLTRRTINCC